MQFFEPIAVGLARFESLLLERRDAKPMFPSRDILAHSTLGADDGAVADLDVSDESDLPGEGDIIAEPGAARNTDLRNEEGMFADGDVVRDLDEVVDFRAFLNPCAAEARPIDGDVRADFDIVVDLHD